MEPLLCAVPLETCSVRCVRERKRERDLLYDSVGVLNRHLHAICSHRKYTILWHTQKTVRVMLSNAHLLCTLVRQHKWKFLCMSCSQLTLNYENKIKMVKSTMKGRHNMHTELTQPSFYYESTRSSHGVKCPKLKSKLSLSDLCWEIVRSLCVFMWQKDINWYEDIFWVLKA